MNQPLLPLSVLCTVVAACSLFLDDDSLPAVNPSDGSSGGAFGGQAGQAGSADGDAGTGAGMTGNDAGAGGRDGSGVGGTPGAAGAGEAGAPSCQPGSSGCACLPAGSCDPGLVCVDASCRTQVGCSPSTIVDDLEDGDRVLCPNQGRNGAWFVFADSDTGSITPASGSALSPVSLAGDARPSSGSAWAMRLTGTGFGDVPGSDYAALAFIFQVENGATRAHDLGAHEGLAFWAKSDVPVKMRLNLTTMPSRGVPQGGTCSGGTCNDHYGVFFDVSSAWTRYTVSFATMTQQGWGKAVVKDLTQAYSLDFMYVGSYEGARLTHDNPSSFDLLVDDVELE